MDGVRRSSNPKKENSESREMSMGGLPYRINNCQEIVQV
jgi:hypothetical protein